MFNIAESYPCNMDTREAATKKRNINKTYKVYDAVYFS